MENITLIGMPGSGKSTLGALLAERLGYRFIDGDQVIESSGRRLQAIIDQDGEDEFLRIEEAELRKLGGERQVFAPGGSCVLAPAAMDHLRTLSVVVYLDVPLALLETRLGTDTMARRGIVGLRHMNLARLYEIRRPLYLRYAHIRVSLDDRPISDCVDILLALLRGRESGYVMISSTPRKTTSPSRISDTDGGAAMGAEDELVAIVDERNRVVGAVRRREMRAGNLPHRATYILVFNSRGELYVQKRTHSKDVFPGYYDVAAGGVILTGESYEEGALRELEEELGIRGIPLTRLFDFSYKDEAVKVWGAVFSCVYDGEMALQQEEVESGAFLAVDEVFRLAATEPFTPDGLYVLRRYGEMSGLG